MGSRYAVHVTASRNARGSVGFGDKNMRRHVCMLLETGGSGEMHSD